MYPVVVIPARPLRRFVLTAECLFYLLASAHAGDAREQHLNAALKNEIVMIRSFYTNSDLEYGPDGTLLRPGHSDCWLAARLRVKDIRIKNDILTFEGPRVVGVYDSHKKEWSNFPDGGRVKVKIHLDPSHSSEQDIDALVLKVFLTSKDNLDELIPTAYISTTDAPSSPIYSALRVDPKNGISAPRPIDTQIRHTLSQRDETACRV